MPHEPDRRSLPVPQTRQALSKPFDLVAASLDERKDDDVSAGVLETLFGHYRFDDDQLKVTCDREYIS